MKPLLFRWDSKAEVMVPIGRATAVAQEQYVDGQIYELEVTDHRSTESHRHYFAVLNEAWRNLPEKYGDRWPTVEKLRKWALIHAGYCRTNSYLAKDDNEAQRVARLLERIEDEAEVRVDDHTVTIRRALSQSQREMSKRQFEQSKHDVIDVVSRVIGVDATTLSERGRNAA